MFLERKFLTPIERDAARAAARDRDAWPPPLADVIGNLGRLLATERHVGHRLPDFGFSQSGHWSREGVIAHYSTELQQNLARYERRFQLVELEAEVDDDGRPYLVAVGRVDGVTGTVTLLVDLARRSVQVARIG